MLGLLIISLVANGTLIYLVLKKPELKEVNSLVEDENLELCLAIDKIVGLERNSFTNTEEAFKAVKKIANEARIKINEVRNATSQAHN